MLVSLFIFGDIQVSRELVDHGFIAMSAESRSMRVDSSCELLPWLWVQVCHLSDTCLWMTKNCHCHDSVCSQYLSSSNIISECNSKWLDLGVEYLRSSHTEVSVEDLPAVTIETHRWGSYSSIVRSRSIREAYPGARCCYVFHFSWPQLGSSYGSIVILQYSGLHRWLLPRVMPAHHVCSLAPHVLDCGHCANCWSRCGVIIKLFRLGAYVNTC